MKKSILITIFLILSVYLFAQPADSLKAQRETLYEKYSELNQPGKELTLKEYKSIVDILKKIIVIDTRIIESYSGVNTTIKKLKSETEALNNENNDLSKKITEYTQLSVLIYISGGFLVLIIVILTIVLIICNRKRARLIKKLD